MSCEFFLVSGLTSPVYLQQYVGHSFNSVFPTFFILRDPLITKVCQLFFSFLKCRINYNFLSSLFYIHFFAYLLFLFCSFSTASAITEYFNSLLIISVLLYYFSPSWNEKFAVCFHSLMCLSALVFLFRKLNESLSPVKCLRRANLI